MLYVYRKMGAAILSTYSERQQLIPLLYFSLVVVSENVYNTEATFLPTPNLSPTVKFPAVRCWAGYLVSHVRCETQDPVPSVMLRYSVNPSHLYVSSHAHCSATAANVVCVIYHTGVKRAGRTISPVKGLHFSKNNSYDKKNPNVTYGSATILLK